MMLYIVHIECYKSGLQLSSYATFYCCTYNKLLTLLFVALNYNKNTNYNCKSSSNKPSDSSYEKNSNGCHVNRNNLYGQYNGENHLSEHTANKKRNKGRT